MKKIIKLIDDQDNLQYEFLSPALEIIERPPSLLGRFSIKLIFSIIITLIIISFVGKVDIVASAHGKVIPNGRLQTIQPMEEGEIIKINVTEGAFVKKGQVLIELNGKVEESDFNEIRKNREISHLEKDIALAQLNNLGADEILKKYSKNEFINKEDLDYQKNLLRSKIEEYENKEKSLLLSIDQQNSELNLHKSEKERLQKEVDYWKEEEKVSKKLFEIGSISKSEWRSKEKELNNTIKNLEGTNIKIIQLGQKILETKKSLISVQSEREKNILSEIVELDKKINELNVAFIKAEQSYKYQKLTSPVNGTVHGLSSYTIGGILKPAETAITIVPEGTDFMAEVMILNKDVGFITKGKEVEIKVEAFSFQKYGTIKGKVINISPDAIQDEKMGYVYKALVSMEKNYFYLGEHKYLVSPGMTLTAEIKTGKRRIIDFFLSPLIKNVDEGMKVR